MSTRIREFRKLHGMTLQTLAQKVGTTAQTIQRLETGNMTVSLDWLTRIADVFKVPAAALLVSDTTASVPILGDLNAAGEVMPPASSDPAAMLSLVIAAPHPVAVHVGETVQSRSTERAYTAGSWLIGGKVDLDPELAMVPKDCLVASINGRISLQRAAIDKGKVVFTPATDKIGRIAELATEVAWIAPVLMAVRYF
jgi:transcriptional regulator with XRE-family HTH domain